MCDLQPVQVADARPSRLGGTERTVRCPCLTANSGPGGTSPAFCMLGAIVIHRAEVRPLEPKYIDLLATFADQAAIAIENVRLFEAKQQRTRELSDSLEQQSASRRCSRSSAALQVISSPCSQRSWRTPPVFVMQSLEIFISGIVLRILHYP
jgi:hypothetical protein